MTTQIQNWVDAHNPILFSGSQGIHAETETVKAINAAQGLDTSSGISTAFIGGTNPQAAINASEALKKLYDEKGPADPAFIEAFTNAPATGMSTVLNMSRIRADFDPQNGKDSLASFNAYIQSIGQCPFITLNNSHADKIGKTFQVTKDIIAAIETNLEFDNSTFMEKVESTIQLGVINETIILDLYVMELIPGADTNLKVSGARVTIDITAGEKQPTDSALGSDDNPLSYSVSYNGFNLLFSMLSANWSKQVATSVANKHFATLEQWAQASSTPS